ncbi:MAG: hypothetical protein H6730_17570 [Deltaproteobacteria bacterium]|nr:hypothetical protein [Deltaproteobacteria bacterium]
MEYDVYEQDIEVKAGEITQVDAVLRRWSTPPAGPPATTTCTPSPRWTRSFALKDRVLAVAAEGVDIACSSDHNFVTDYRPHIADQNIEDFVQGMVGLEMTTLEVGHFNGFPLKYDPGPITKGAFEWSSGRPPQDLFNDLRALGSLRARPDHHPGGEPPRDTILGYFNDYNFNPDTGEVEESDSILLSPEGPEFAGQGLVELRRARALQRQALRAPVPLPHPRGAASAADPRRDPACGHRVARRRERQGRLPRRPRRLVHAAEPGPHLHRDGQQRHPRHGRRAWHPLHLSPRWPTIGWGRWTSRTS